MGFDVFRTAPAPLSTPQRRLVVATAILVAATRLIAISATLWDWDEALFVLAVREYEVTQHHPHPPGFPVFIAAAKLVAFFGVSEFRALQTIVVIASMSLFPLLFFLGRELRFELRTSYLGALLFAFFPNVWYYGGTALSDVAALALIVGACALLLRGCRDVRAYYIGAFVLALAAGVRPQSLMMAVVPALLASWIQFRISWKRFVIATLLGAVVLAACYTGAILASESPSAYFATMRGLRAYIHDVDSIANPHRQPLAQVAEPIFLRPMRGGRLPLVVLALASIGVIASFVKRHAGVWLLLTIFLPFAVFAWLMLDTNSMCRYAIVWLPMYAMLCAYGVASLARFAPRGAIAEVVLLLAITLRFAWWTWPALDDARTNPSPPAAALAWAAKQPGTIYAHGSLGPMADALLPPRKYVITEGELPIAPKAGDIWVTEGLIDSIEQKTFQRAHHRLWQIVRQRYFEVSAAPVASIPRLGDGWWSEESDGRTEWRWMGSRSVTRLAAVGAHARLTLRVICATEKQSVDVTLNRNRVATFDCNQQLAAHDWTVDSRTNALNELVITTNRVVNPARDFGMDDRRDLGVRVEGIGWKAAP